MAAAPQLNLDVLASACEFLSDVSEFLAFALTCSSLRPVATQWLLSIHPVSLIGGLSVQRFHAFLFADAPARAPHLHALDIRLTWPWPFPHQHADQSTDASLFLDILTSCPNLRHVSLSLQRELDRGPDDLRILHAIAALTHLRSLSVYGLPVDRLALIRQVPSPLRMLSIQCQSMRGGILHLDPLYPAALEEFLPRHFMPTLRELQFLHFTVDADVIQAQFNSLVPSVFDMTQYPAIHSLSVYSFEGTPLLDHLQHLFPALDGSLHLGRLDYDILEDAYPDIRAANQHAQESDGDGSPTRGWKKLDRVVCDVPMFYVLGLHCPIRLVMLDYGSDRVRHYARDALRENPVPRLKLTLAHQPHSALFNGLFSLELAETLTHLTLCLMYSNNIDAHSHSGPDGRFTPRPRWDAVLDNVLSALQPLHKLTHLRVIVHASVYVHKDAPSPQVPPLEEYAHTFRGSAFDFDGTAASLVRPHPSLRYLFLTTSGYLSNWHEDEISEFGSWKAYERWHTTHGWRVADPQTDSDTRGERALVELHDNVSDTIIRNEELVLSEGDEAALHMHPGRD